MLYTSIQDLGLLVSWREREQGRFGGKIDGVKWSIWEQYKGAKMEAETGCLGLGLSYLRCSSII